MYFIKTYATYNPIVYTEGVVFPNYEYTPPVPSHWFLYWFQKSLVPKVTSLKVTDSVTGSWKNLEHVTENLYLKTDIYTYVLSYACEEWYFETVYTFGLLCMWGVVFPNCMHLCPILWVEFPYCIQVCPIVCMWGVVLPNCIHVWSILCIAGIFFSELYTSFVVLYACEGWYFRTVYTFCYCM